MTASPPTALLCESCGYPLAGLAIDAECPECGLVIEQSLPARRQGSRAQQRRSWRAWIDSGAAVLAEPRDTLRRAAIEPRRSRGMLFTSTFIASLLATTPILAVAGAYSLQIGIFDLGAAIVTVLLFFAATWAILLAASWIELMGIRFFGARRAWRITTTVALVVVAHAAIGWVAGGLIAAAGAVLAAIAGLIIGGDTPVVAVAMGGLIMGAAIGLLWFETLVYTGVRACRFANPPGADVASLEGEEIEAAGTQDPAPQPAPPAPVSNTAVADSAHAYDGGVPAQGAPTLPHPPRADSA